MGAAIRVAAVEYLNTLPFVYGLRQVGLSERITLTLAPPSRCADLLASGAVDLALVPVAALLRTPGVQVVSNYCIGARGAVETVCVFSMLPIERVKRIYLDGDSRTSVGLVRILARYLWNISPEFCPLGARGVEGPRSATDAYLLIGDKVFAQARYFEYSYDLAEEWARYTEGEPFVFAVWAAREGLDSAVLEELNFALGFGVAHVEAALQDTRCIVPVDSRRALDYLIRRISYSLDAQKRRAMARYLDLLPFVEQEVAPGAGRGSQRNEEQHDNYIL